MSKTAHWIYISLLVLVVTTTLVLLIAEGTGYYSTAMEERFFHDDHNALKPSGVIGHGLGIIGSLCMLIGVSAYMLRKRARMLSRLGFLKHWLEFHIFLCTLGPILVVFHTAFKFGGIVAISFWSMVAVFLSGIIGRFIYLQIPRTIEGRELSLNEIKSLKVDIGGILKDSYSLHGTDLEAILGSIQLPTPENGEHLTTSFFKKRKEEKLMVKKIKAVIHQAGLAKEDRKKILKLVRNEISLNRRIERLSTMQNLFRYWHVVHLPFALVMLVIMVIHVVVTVVFGFKWIF